MRKMVSKAGVVVAAVGLVIVAPSPANALVSKSGSKSCPVGEVVTVTANGDGHIKFYINGNLRYEVFRLSISSVTYKTGNRSANWKVTSDGYLGDPGTYAYCVDNNINPVPPAE